MFVEKLTQDDVLGFLLKRDNIKKKFENWKYTVVSNNFSNQRIEGIITFCNKSTNSCFDLSYICKDFDIITNIDDLSVRYPGFCDDKWVKFMNAKFGEDYKKEFEKFKEKQGLEI